MFSSVIDGLEWKYIIILYKYGTKMFSFLQLAIAT